jgi:hypothetical protein
MKMSSEARTELKRLLREHPAIREHVPKLQDLNRLTKQGLIALAETLGINVAGVAESQLGARKSGLSDVDHDLMLYSHNHPAFAGVLEFDLRIAMLGLDVVRKARVIYTYTPEWEYFDLNKKAVMKGWGGSTMKLEVLATPGTEVWVLRAGQSKSTRAGPEWELVSDLLQTGVMSPEMEDALDAEIDKRARTEDLQRRRDARQN